MSDSANNAPHDVTALTNIIATQQPLIPGLRAAAAESDSHHQAQLLARLADSLEQGMTLAAAVKRERLHVPVELSRLLSLSDTTLRNRLLVEWTRQQRHESRSLQQLRSALKYPALLLWLTSIVILFLYLVVSNDLSRFNEDLSDDSLLPGMSLFPAGFTDLSAWLLLGLVLSAPLILMIVQVIGRAPVRNMLSGLIPGMAGVQHWLFLARNSRSLALLLDSGLPLPAALEQLSDDPTRHHAHEELNDLRQAVMDGMSLSDALAANVYWPSTLSLFARRGELLQQLPTTLRGAAALYELRAELRTRWLRQTLPTLVFFIVGSVTLAIYSSWLAPLLRMISMLTTGFGAPAAGGTGANVAHPLHLAGLLLVGLATQLATNLVFGNRSRKSQSVLQQILNLTAAMLCVLSIFAMLFSLASWLSLISLILFLAWLMETFWNYRNAERRGLLAHLSLAAEHGVPLPLAIRAYGIEQGERYTRRAEQLAAAVDSGVPLVNALDLVGYRLTIGQHLAVAIGSETGHLSEPLQDALKAEEETRTTFKWMYEKLAYLALIFFMVGVACAFISLRIEPMFSTMLGEFGIVLTQSSIWVNECVSWLHWIVGGSFLLVIGPLLGLLGMPLWFRDLPIVGRLTMKHDGAWVMRGMAWMLGHNLPVPQALQLIATHYPKSRVRRAVRTVQLEAENGGNWSLSLATVGLVRTVDAGLLLAAQRLGNVIWSLRETADATTRRIALRLRYLSQFLFPVAIIMLALCVFIAAYSVFRPLIQLLESLP